MLAIYGRMESEYEWTPDGVYAVNPTLECISRVLFDHVNKAMDDWEESENKLISYEMYLEMEQMRASTIMK